MWSLWCFSFVLCAIPGHGGLLYAFVWGLTPITFKEDTLFQTADRIVISERITVCTKDSSISTQRWNMSTGELSHRPPPLHSSNSFKPKQVLHYSSSIMHALLSGLILLPPKYGVSLLDLKGHCPCPKIPTQPHSHHPSDHWPHPKLTRISCATPPRLLLGFPWWKRQGLGGYPQPISAVFHPKNYRSICSMLH